MNKLDSTFAKDLLPGEVIHWSGIPRQGVYLQLSDALMIPFSLMWAGFAFFWEYEVYTRWKASAIEGTQGPGMMFVLWGIPFVLVGLYMVVGRFFIDAYTRAGTQYAVTNKRVLIKSRGLHEQKLVCVEKEKLPEMEVSRLNNGRMTIAFGPNTYYGRRRRDTRPTLEQIQDGETALQWIHQKV